MEYGICAIEYKLEMNALIPFSSLYYQHNRNNSDCNTADQDGDTISIDRHSKPIYFHHLNIRQMQLFSRHLFHSRSKKEILPDQRTHTPICTKLIHSSF